MPFAEPGSIQVGTCDVEGAAQVDTHYGKSNMETWNNLDTWVWCFVKFVPGYVDMLCQLSVRSSFLFHI